MKDQSKPDGIPDISLYDRGQMVVVALLRVLDPVSQPLPLLFVSAEARKVLHDLAIGLRWIS